MLEEYWIAGSIYVLIRAISHTQWTIPKQSFRYEQNFMVERNGYIQSHVLPLINKGRDEENSGVFLLYPCKKGSNLLLTYMFTCSEAPHIVLSEHQWEWGPCTALDSEELTHTVLQIFWWSVRKCWCLQQGISWNTRISCSNWKDYTQNFQIANELP